MANPAPTNGNGFKQRFWEVGSKVATIAVLALGTSHLDNKIRLGQTEARTTEHHLVLKELQETQQDLEIRITSMEGNRFTSKDGLDLERRVAEVQAQTFAVLEQGISNILQRLARLEALLEQRYSTQPDEDQKK